MDVSKSVRDWNHELRIQDVPSHWRNNIEASWRERCEIALLRMAGCKCELPLLGGYMEEYGNTYIQASVRCRLCNVSVYLDIALESPESQSERVSSKRGTETPVKGGKALYGVF